MNRDRGNPLGLDLDQNGQPLNTSRNLGILEEIERANAAKAYGRHPEPIYGYETSVPQNGAYYPESRYREDDRYSYEDRSRREEPLQRRIYREREESMHREPYYRERSESSSSGSASGHSKYAVYDDENNEPIHKSYRRESESAYQENNVVDNRTADQILYDVDVIKDIFIPTGSIYHFTLLPKGYREDRLVSLSKLLRKYTVQDKNKNNVEVADVARFYINKIFKENEEVDMQTNDRFSENLFKDQEAENKVVTKVQVVEIRPTKDTEDKSCNMIMSLNNNHLTNRFLIEIAAIPNYSSEAIYSLDYINSASYYSTMSKNMFVEKARDVRNFKDGAIALLEIFDKYAENESNYNSLLSIDTELTKDFLIYVRGFTGVQEINCASFMRQVEKMHEALDKHPDDSIRRNTKVAIERFTNMLFINIKGLSNVILDSAAANKMIVLRKELGILTKKKSIREELNGLEKSNESTFYYIDEMYTPELFRLVTQIDEDKSLANYTKVTLYTVRGLYQIIKTKDKGFFLSLSELYEI